MRPPSERRVEMSSYIVEKETIDHIVYEATRQRAVYVDPDGKTWDAFKDPDAFGQMLVDVNVEAVTARYDEDSAKRMLPQELEAPYKWPGAKSGWPVLVDSEGTCTPKEAWRALREYGYQVDVSSAFDDFLRFIEGMETALADEIVESS